MKKKALLLILVLLTITLFNFASSLTMSYSLSSTFTSPQVQNNIIGPAEALQKVVGSVGNFLNVFLAGGENTTNQAKFVLLLILIAIIYSVLIRAGLFTEHKALSMLIAVLVSLLAVRFLTSEWVVTILLPYGTLGVAISTLLPFMIYFWFVEWGMQDNPLLRKISWIVFAVAFLFLLFSRLREPSGVGMWFYIAVIVLSIALLFFDGTIQKFLFKVEAEKTRAKSLINQIRVLEVRRNELIEQMRGAETAEQRDAIKTRIDEIDKQIKALTEELK